MNNHAHRRLDGESHRVWDAVIDAYEAHTEAADIHYVALRHRMKIAARYIVFLQPPRQYAERQLRAIDRHIEFLQHIRERPDMILMAMREHDGLHLVAIFHEICDVWNHEVNAKHVVLREHETSINQKNLVPISHDRHIFADFPQSAQGNNLQFLSTFRQKIHLHSIRFFNDNDLFDFLFRFIRLIFNPF